MSTGSSAGAGSTSTCSAHGLGGTQRPASDIDLAVLGAEPVPPGLLAGLREAIEESTVPYRVDVVDLADADPAFRDGGRREGIRWIASDSG